MENKGLSICIDKEHLNEVGLKNVSDMVSDDFKIDISSESNKIVVKYPDGSEEHFYKKSD